MSRIPLVSRSVATKLRLWDYLAAQISTPMQDEIQVTKHERVYNFLHVPQKLEQVHFKREPAQKLPYFGFDLLRGLLLFTVCVLLQQIDASRVYHSIRGQSVIKLYVIFNVFEV
ncbi:hypothetical protein PSACC_03663 [Paramicrosporidium saccamoebae]|uniref:Uncharacterized protein n=1 Tax=Paramicrosporidium saccamoebae TaxID=1246581 RepID=A0A2H9TFH9_9FUNG|nr:hypothetical protein PSACC_03663 [Paramicrosporidium saccamoebae]